MKLTQKQRMAKSRLAQHIKDNPATVSMETLTVAEMSKICKTTSLPKWLLDEEFAKWWYDADTVSTTVLACQEIAVERLLHILQHPIEGGRDAIITSKDVLNAAKTILELGDAFPKSKKEIVFADRKINNMDEDQVAKELAEGKKKRTVAGDS